jgi:hypothetical protein
MRYDHRVAFTMGSTDFLFPAPSSLYGLARLLDLAGQLDTYNTSPNGAIADYIAIYNDWSVVGGDLLEALEKELEEHLAKHPA